MIACESVKLFLKRTYNTNAIEESTRTINEIKIVLEGITVGGKRLAYYNALDKANASLDLY